MKHYAEVIIPLAINEQLTYLVPEGMNVSVGSRVVVPLGARKYYTAIVANVTTEFMQEGYALKEIAEVSDKAPILLPYQLDLWAWIARYYMCTIGEVMKAALPSGLKIESESIVKPNPEYDSTELLTPRELEVLSVIDCPKGCSVETLAKQLKIKNALPLVHRLLDKGIVLMAENMIRSFAPRTELHVRIKADYLSETAINILFDSLTRAAKQQHLLLRYLDLSKASTAITLKQPSLMLEVSKAELLKGIDGGEAALTALRNKKILETYPFEIGRLGSKESFPECVLPQLNAAQQRAYDEIIHQFEQNNICLLHGVTSSGKTEVYTRLIRHTLDTGGQVLYLLPEIALTTQIMQRMSRAFGAALGVYHSKFPDAERVEIWNKQLSEHPYQLVLGARSALFLPFTNLRLIIVDEEHETSYKQQDPAPRYNARDTAMVMAKMCSTKEQKVNVLLGTATPSFDVYKRALEGKYGLVTMTERYGNIQLPKIVVENVKELRRKKLMNSPFSPRLLTEMKAAFEQGEQVILFQNRRGYSPIIECHTCGWVPRCTRCDVSLTLHQKEHRMVCHYCGASYAIPHRCPNCEETDLRDLGYGTEKIETSIKTFFPKAQTARLDLDTTRQRVAYERIINDFQQGRTDILIGTQMVTKGLDFDKVRVVGILNADQSLSAPNFRAYERAYQMLSQVAGRAGRKGRQGIVVLQTCQPNLPVIDYIVNNNYQQLYKEQLEERQHYHYPPYYRLINIFLKHRDEQKVEAAAQLMASWLQKKYAGNLLGPDRPLVGRVQLLYIRQMMLKIETNTSVSAVRDFLNACKNALQKNSTFRTVNVYFDVDPM